MWLRIGPVADSYKNFWWTFAFHRQQEISCGTVLYFILARYLHVFCCLFTFVLYIFLLVLQFFLE